METELLSVMVSSSLAISTKVLREDRETTLLIINVFSLQRGLQNNKKTKTQGSQNPEDVKTKQNKINPKRESVRSPNTPDSTNISRAISHLPGKSPK